MEVSLFNNLAKKICKQSYTDENIRKCFIEPYVELYPENSKILRLKYLEKKSADDIADLLRKKNGEAIDRRTVFKKLDKEILDTRQTDMNFSRWIKNDFISLYLYHKSKKDSM